MASFSRLLSLLAVFALASCDDEPAPVDSGPAVDSSVADPDSGGVDSGTSDAGSDAALADSGAPSARTPNMPSGLSTLFEESFEYTWTGTEGIPPGWSDAGIWRPDHCATVADPNAPDGARALRTQIEDGVPSPGGACRLELTLGGAYSRFYIAFSLNFEPGFHHNGARPGDGGSGSEKIIHFNFYAGSYLFQYHWGAEAIMNIAPDPADVVTPSDLHANQMPRDAADNFIAPPPPDAEWTRYEIYLDANTGTVQWWTNGELRAHHVGRTFDPIVDVSVGDTWGGGGTKQGTEGRLVDDIIVAGAP